MDDGYSKKAGIIEMKNYKHYSGQLDFIVTWDEPDRVKGLDLEATKKRVCELIKARGLKDRTIAEHLGITPQAVNKWRRKGTFFVIENLYALSGLLSVSVDELLVPIVVKKMSIVFETTTL